MKIRGAQLLICALTVGMATIAGITGIATIKGSENIETIEYVMADNKSVHTQEPVIVIQTGNGAKYITQCSNISEIIKGLPKEMLYKRLYLKGYQGCVLALTGSTVKKDGKNSSHYAFLYTIQDSHVYYIGLLTTGDQNYPLRIDDGIIYASNKYDYNTFYMEPNGKELFEKDRLNYATAQGFTTDKNNYTWYEPGTSFKVISKENYQKKNNSIPVIDFEKAK